MSSVPRIFTVTFPLLILLSLQACSLTVPVDSPEASLDEYEFAGAALAQKTVYAFKDQLPFEHEISTAPFAIHLVNNGSKIRGGDFFAKHLQAELAGRGIPIEFGESDEQQIQLDGIDVISRRVSGFSPMVTLSTAKVKLLVGGEEYRLASMVKRAKVPVWSMSELNEPCYNEPIELLVKEIAAKINRIVYRGHLSDEKVAALAQKVFDTQGSSKTAYLDTYELGFSNNPKAISSLRKLRESKNDYVRMAAISSLGTIGSVADLDMLMTTASSAKLWHDRGMALKAIGDIGSPEAVEFLLQEHKKWQGKDSNEAEWNRVIIELYVDQQ